VAYSVHEYEDYDQGGMMKKRILVVDDSEVVRAMAINALERGGFDVITASNGIEANRYLFRKDRPDVIVLDVMIPLLHGDKIAKVIKENKHTRDIPILLLSSKPADELRRMVIDSGADGFIQKPFTSKIIVEKVCETMRLKFAEGAA
jgi:DNA-binding response OmpR family regulator